MKKAGTSAPGMSQHPKDNRPVVQPLPFGFRDGLPVNRKAYVAFTTAGGVHVWFRTLASGQ